MRLFMSSMKSPYGYHQGSDDCTPAYDATDNSASIRGKGCSFSARCVYGGSTRLSFRRGGYQSS